MRNLSKKAFSFVELLVVITILSIIGAIWVSLNDGYKEKTYNTKVVTDLATIENALIRFKQEKSFIPSPEGNLKYFTKDGYYAHDENDAFGFHGFITETTIPKRFINVIPRDPRSKNYYAYGKTLNSGLFEVAGVNVFGDKFESVVRGTYIGQDPLYNLIREYNGPDFVYDKSKKNFPYNPEEMIMDAKIVAFTGELVLNNTITDKNKILERSLLPGDNIKLSTGSTATIYYSDGSYSELGSNDSALELTLSVMKYKKDNNLFTRVRLALNFGAIVTKASKMSGESNLDLYTIDTEASVRGTIFEMKRIQGDNKTYVKVIKGSIFLNMINIADYDTLLSILKDDKEISPKTPIIFPGYTEIVVVDGHQESILKEGGDFTISASPSIPAPIPATCATDEHYETVGGCLKNIDNCDIVDTDGTTIIGVGTKSWNIVRGSCEAISCFSGFVLDTANKTCIKDIYSCGLNYTYDGTSCVPDTRVFTCSTLPNYTKRNTVSSYNQTWDGIKWEPVNSTPIYDLTSSTISCVYKCIDNYSWSLGSCVPITKPANCGGSVPLYAYKTTSNTYTQTWNGTKWTPVLSWEYNKSECGFKCNPNYSWNSSSCIPATKIYDCPSKPSGYTQRNKVDKYTQTWDGTKWTPSDSSTKYDTSSSTTSCRYKCESGANRNGSSCIKCKSGYTWDSSAKKCVLKCPSGFSDAGGGYCKGSGKGCTGVCIKWGADRKSGLSCYGSCGNRYEYYCSNVTETKGGKGVACQRQKAASSLTSCWFKNCPWSNSEDLNWTGYYKP